ncbi:hypothetical protein NXX23_19660 [Bacteroides ovatus]|nr:hypothetical protein [Bacteroides ovatus]
MKQIIELRDTEKRKMIAETFGISLANLSQILRFKRNGKNAEAIRRMAQENGGIKYTEGNEPSKSEGFGFSRKCNKSNKQ